MTNQEKIELLISREINGELNEDEKLLLKQWLEAKDGNRLIYERQKQLVQAQLNVIGQKRVSDSREQIKTGVINHLLRKNRKVKHAVYSSVSVLVVAFITTALFFNQGINQRDQLLAGTFKIVAPAGQTANFTLPEGSEVWLNAASELTFGYDMDQNIRRARLEGEGYFKVAHDDKRPFIVDGYQHQIKVYGTEFMVISDSEKKHYEVTLHKGSVGVFDTQNHELARLIPGQQFQTDETGKGTIITVSNLETEKAWMQGRYEFKDATLEEIAQKMSELYDVDIVITDEKLKKERFRCVLEQHRSIIKTLKIFSLTSNLDYEIKKDEVILKKKN